MHKGKFFIVVSFVGIALVSFYYFSYSQYSPEVVEKKILDCFSKENSNCEALLSKLWTQIENTNFKESKVAYLVVASKAQFENIRASKVAVNPYWIQFLNRIKNKNYEAEKYAIIIEDKVKASNYLKQIHLLREEIIKFEEEHRGILSEVQQSERLLQEKINFKPINNMQLSDSKKKK